MDFREFGMVALAAGVGVIVGGIFISVGRRLPGALAMPFNEAHAGFDALG